MDRFQRSAPRPSSRERDGWRGALRRGRAGGHRFSYALSEGESLAGRLRIAADPQYDGNGKPVLGLRLTSRRFVGDHELDQIMEACHADIVKAFTAVTTPHMHEQWGEVSMIAEAPSSETTLHLSQRIDDVTPRAPQLGDGTGQFEARFSELAELQQGWDGYGAQPIDRHALVLAEGVVRDTLRAGWPTPELFPVPNGGVQLEWGAGSMELELEIEPGGRGVVFVGDDPKSGRRFDGELPRDAALLRQAATTLGVRLRERVAS